MSPDAKRTRRTRTSKYETAKNQPMPTSSVRKEARRTKDQSQVRVLLVGWVLNPYLAFLLLLGIGVASFRVAHQLRLTLIWLVLLVLVLLYADSGRLKANYSLLNLLRGMLTGAIIALPLFLFAKDFFHATALHLYGVDDPQVLLERAVFLVPILEESFFRGIVQRERGKMDGALLFGLAQALYFISAANVFPVVIGAVALGTILLGLLYGSLYERYGLTSSIGCHIAVNFVLLVLPTLMIEVGKLLAF
jgi:membrane protease YdiL (CAAX protease family)